MLNDRMPSSRMLGCWQCKKIIKYRRLNMAEQADVYVENKFQGSIVVTRKRPDGSSVDATISNEVNENEKKFPLLVPEESLIINAPEGFDTEDYPIVVRSGIIDLKVTTSRTNWTIKIVPNDLPPEVPTTANVNVGEDGEG